MKSLGTFKPYTPDDPPQWATVHRVVFFKNEKDEDWYSITKKQDKYDGKRLYLGVNEDGIIVTQSTDATMLAPENLTVFYTNLHDDPDSLIGKQVVNGSIVHAKAATGKV